MIAEDRYIAEDACDLIEVEYEPLPAVLDPFEAQEGGRAARPREARDERRLRAHVHVRRGRPGVRRGAAQGAGEAALAALDRHADGHERRDRRLRRGTGVVTIYANSMNFTYFHWLIAGSLKIPASKLRVVPVAAGGSFGSKFFMHKVPTFAGFLSMLVGPPGEVRRGPGHAHRQQRPLRLRPLVRRRARLRRRRHVPRAADRLRRRLRRVPAVRHRARTATRSRRSSGRTGSSTSSTRCAAMLTNKNQQGAYRGFGAECSTGCSSGSWTWPRATSAWTASRSAGAT